MGSPVPALERSVKRLVEDNDLDSPDAGLLLWWLRYGLAIDEFEAFEYVLDSDHVDQIDGWYIAESEDSLEEDRLLLFEVKANFDAPQRLRAADLKHLADVTARIRNDPRGWLRSSPEWRTISRRRSIERRLSKKDLRVVPVLVTSGQMSPALTKEAGNLGVTVHAGEEMENLAKALGRSDFLDETLPVIVPSDKRFGTSIGPAKQPSSVVVAEVPAMQIAGWPGIDDRSLFGLNVRHELTSGRIRDELDQAIERENDHPFFLAYHNGLTVVCERLESDDDQLRVVRPSVVNGAQSVIALRRNRDALTNRLTLLVKFVEVSAIPELPLEVARRSNTQNPVNPRNLRALDGLQQRLAQEFDDGFPAFEYVTRPDKPVTSGRKPILNDDAAQWLCCLWAQRPWLAVKRTELFRSPAYRLVFTPNTHAERVVLSYRLREIVQPELDRVPKIYRRSWRLVALTHLYLLGQVLRGDSVASDWFEDPAACLRGDEIREKARAVNAAAHVTAVLNEYHAQQVHDFEFDDFKVNFKREQALRDLSQLARRS